MRRSRRRIRNKSGEHTIRNLSCVKKRLMRSFGSKADLMEPNVADVEGLAFSCIGHTPPRTPLLKKLDKSVF